MKNLILFVGFLVLIGCEDFPFTDKDIQNKVSTEKSETINQQNDEKIENLHEGNNLSVEEQNTSINKEAELQIIESIPSAEKKPFSKDERRQARSAESSKTKFRSVVGGLGLLPKTIFRKGLLTITFVLRPLRKGSKRLFSSGLRRCLMLPKRVLSSMKDKVKVWS